jgi:hypothetical protein
MTLNREMTQLEETIRNEKELERESQIETFIDQISDSVNNEVRDFPKTFGLTKRDVKQGTEKFCQAINDEISRCVREEFD